MREYLQAFRDEWNKARLFVLKLDDMVTVPSVDVAKFCSQNRLALLKAGKKFTKHAPLVNLTTSLGDFRGDRLGFDDALTYVAIREFSQERELYPPHACIDQTPDSTRWVRPCHDLLGTRKTCLRR